MSLPIPNPYGNVSTQKVKSSWINNLQANTYVAPYGLMFFDTYDGVLRLGDGSTPGGQLITTGGGGGNGTPAAPNGSIQFNNSGAFGGNIALTFDAANSVLSLTGQANVIGNINVVGNVHANTVYDDDGIFLNANVITMSYTLPPGYNGITGGPITIEDPAVVTIPVGQRWTIV
jgi:hypothetical protein